MAVLTKITSRSLADNAVTSAHVQGDVIAAGDIAAGAIGSSELADDAVGAAQLASDAVVNASVASGAAIGLTKLAQTGTLTATNIAATGTITGNPKATNATTVAATYANEQEVVHGTTFTTTGSTVTGDVVFESLSDEAITLSGTGTITGSGGKIIGKGLEKTSVGEATRVGKYTQSDFNVKGTLGTDVKFPSGHVLQVVFDKDTGTHRTNNTDQWLVMGGLNPTITSTVAGSKFMLHAASGYQGYGAIQFLDFRRTTGDTVEDLIMTTKGIGTRDFNGTYGGWHTDNAGVWTGCFFPWLDQPNYPAGTTIKYEIMMRTSASTLTYWLHSGSMATFTVYEIAP